VITGYGDKAGGPLAAHPDVAHITFTGSIPTGKTVMKSAADHVASVTLELGGKSPVVELADADLDAAVDGTLKTLYLNAEQVCSAGSREVETTPLASGPSSQGHRRESGRPAADAMAVEPVAAEITESLHYTGWANFGEAGDTERTVLVLPGDRPHHDVLAVIGVVETGARDQQGITKPTADETTHHFQ